MTDRAEHAEYAVGAVVRCDNGACGLLRRLIVDSSSHAVTHLVVEPDHQRGTGRLVPIGLVEHTTAHEVRLCCTRAQFDALDPAEKTDVRPGLHLDWEYLQAQATWRFGPLTDLDGSGAFREKTEPVAVEDENIPRGEGEISFGQPVHASDGPIGNVDALLTDPDGRLVTHVLLREGHAWGKKDVAVPIGAVKFVVDDGVYLALTKDEVGKLPAADLQRMG